MRLTDQQIRLIRECSRQVAGEHCSIRLFGSRLDDAAHGGDIDLLLEVPDPVDNPAVLAAQLSARISLAMGGRKVDVIILAPNLRHLPIHDIALAEGKVL